MDQLLAIRAFSRVVETGNFTKAAGSLRMPKATVSKLVRDLEAHLGVQLLARTTRKVAVTPEGRAYHERSGRILRELEDVDGSFGASLRPRGKLRVDMGSSVASHIVIPALPGFLDRYPDLRVELGVSDRDADVVGDNVDCVIRGGPMRGSSLVSRRVGRASWVTCATPGYLAAHGTPRTPAELAKHRVAMYLSAQMGRVIPPAFQIRGRTEPLDVRPVSAINLSTAHFSAGLAGVGIVQVFRYLAAEPLARGELVEILDRYRPPPYPFHVAYPPNRHVSSRLRAFLDWTVEAFAKLP